MGRREVNQPGRRNICVAQERKSWQIQRMGKSNSSFWGCLQTCLLVNNRIGGCLKANELERLLV